MGQFSRAVRDYKVPGPNQRRFERTLWQRMARDVEADAEDRALASAGLFFDELLAGIRSNKALADLPLSRDALIRLMVSLATANLIVLRERMETSTESRPDTTVHLAEELQSTVKLATGDQFLPDEVLGVLGDGLKHVLRDLLSQERGSGADEYSASQEDVDRMSEQLNVAILYDAGVAYWLDFVGHGYVLELRATGIVMRPSDPKMEISRIASAYRRRNIVYHHFMQLGEMWLHQFPPALRRRLRGTPVVTRIHGSDYIEKIELGWNHEPLFRGLFAVAERLHVLTGPYQNLADDPLPGLANISLRRLLDAWVVLQSVAEAVYKTLSFKEASAKSLVLLAPRIPARILAATLARAMECPQDEAIAILSVLTFTARADQEVWTHPLLRLGTDFVIVIPCILMANLQRIADVWLRQGKIDLSKKGPAFERYCVEHLESLRRGSVLEAHSSVSGSITFSAGGESEEIDLVVIVDRTVLILEAKCVLWPEEPLQYANYRTTIDEAATQARRKREHVAGNYPAFTERLQRNGVAAPEAPTIICGVLTNSAVYSGFPVRGVPVTDLLILGAFFGNELVKAEIRAAGKIVERHAIRFFESPIEAGQRLERYLLEPPQLDDTLGAIKSRSVTWPCEHREFGSLVHETFQVEMDTRALLEKRRAKLRLDE